MAGAKGTQMGGYGVPPGGAAGGPTPHRELAAQRKAANRRALAAMMLMPWLFFTAVVLMYAFLYHSMPGVCLLMVAQLVFISFLFVIFDVKASHTAKHGGMGGAFGDLASGMGGAAAGGGHGQWYLKLGLLTLGFTMGACFVGDHLYGVYFAPYWVIRENASYVNVLPSEPAAAHMDAGELVGFFEYF